jgi:hypothetical protein
VQVRGVELNQSRRAKARAGKVTVENRRGVDAALIRAAMAEVLAIVDAEVRGRGEAAA